MTTDHIYTLVNTVTAEAIGHSAITTCDTSTLIALGNTVLSSSTNTEAFISTLLQRIGRTILSYRKYRNRLADMVIDDFEYGKILQKHSLLESNNTHFWNLRILSVRWMQRRNLLYSVHFWQLSRQECCCWEDWMIHLL